ncbi:ribosomal protein S6 [Sparassis latifolia]
MPFYQMLCISSHYPEYKHIKDLVHFTAMHVMNQGGVVRRLNSWGTLSLPQRMRRHKTYNSIGDYWTMHFDASPRILKSLNAQMRRDPRVIRCTMIKLGQKVEDVVHEKEKTIQRRGSAF